MALVLAPEGPVAEWLEDLDALMARSPGFFAGRADRPRRLGAAAAQGRAQPSHRAAARARHPHHGHRGRRAVALGPRPAAADGRRPQRRRGRGAGAGERQEIRAAGHACRPAGEADAGLAADRRAGPLRPVDHLPEGRRDRRRLGRVRRRDHRRRLDPRLRRAARPRHRRLDGQQPRPHLLPQARSRAPGDRRPLPDRRRHGPTAPRPAGPGLARRRRDHDGNPSTERAGEDGRWRRSWS